MNLCAHRIFFKLPKDIFVVDGSIFRGIHRVSCFSSVDRAVPFLGCSSQPHTKDFHFPCTAVQPFRSISCRPAVCSATRPGRTNVLVICQRFNATSKQANKDSGEKKSLMEAKESPYAHLTVTQKVKEVGKDVSYTAVILVGIAVTGLMFFMIGRELLSSQSPSGVYGDALKKCQNSIEVAAALGEPIKGYGETTRRGRRRHVSHTEFDVGGIPHMRMRFYIEGPYKKATVHVEVQKGDDGKYQYRYLVVETEGYPHRSFILEDNR